MSSSFRAAELHADYCKLCIDGDAAAAAVSRKETGGRLIINNSRRLSHIMSLLIMRSLLVKIKSLVVSTCLQPSAFFSDAPRCHGYRV